MDLILDGWNAFVLYPGLIAAGLVCAAWGAFVIDAAVSRAASLRLDLPERLALAIAGWPLPVLLLAAAGLGAGLLGGVRALTLVVLLAAAALAAAAFAARRAVPANAPAAHTLGLAALLSVLVFIRIGYAAGALLPQYFDSAEHYRIARLLADGAAAGIKGGPVEWPAPAYYHLGFHLLTALPAVLWQADIKAVMLVLGQLLLACIPFPLYFIVKRITRSHAAGLWSVLLAGLGWSMPAHAADWGKYPALAGLLTIQFTLGAAYAARTGGGWSLRSPLTILAAAGLAVSFLFHTRTVVVFGLLAASWLLAGGWLALPRVWRTISLILCMSLIGGIIFIHRAGDLRLAFEPYLQQGALASGLVMLGFPFAVRSYPRPALTGLFAILLMCAALLVPLGGLVPGYPGLTLLDRPFVQMLLFMPLAWLGGLGLAALLPSMDRLPATARALGLSLLAACVCVHAFVRYDFRPSDCCAIAGYDDAAALDWLGEHLPADAVIAIAAAQLTLSEPGPDRAFTGIDAGIWIAPLTGRKTFLLRHTFDLASAEAPAFLCPQGVTHIYAGGESQSFPASQLEARPAWYRPVFTLPGARIYELQACPAVE